MLINQNQISPDTMSCSHLRGPALCLRSWLHSCTKLSHPCRLTQAPAGSPDSSAGCWCRGVYLTSAGEPCPPRARWTLQQDRWYRRELLTLQPPLITAGPRSAGYVGELQTHLLCNAFFSFFFLTPPQDLLQQNWSGTFHFLASALLPSMKRVMIRLASNWKRWGFRTHPALKS